MDLSLIVALVLNVLFLLVSIGLMYFANKWKKEAILRLDAYIKLQAQKKSSEVRSGLITEQMVPFLSQFKHNPLNAHFIGKPIDYIVFNDDEIVFVEIKYGKSSLKSNQRNIRDLIIAKKVRWEEISINESTGNSSTGTG